jgi:hypothetical protein
LAAVQLHWLWLWLLAPPGSNSRRQGISIALGPFSKGRWGEDKEEGGLLTWTMKCHHTRVVIWKGCDAAAVLQILLCCAVNWLLLV